MAETLTWCMITKIIDNNLMVRIQAKNAV